MIVSLLDVAESGFCWRKPPGFDTVDKSAFLVLMILVNLFAASHLNSGWNFYNFINLTAFLYNNTLTPSGYFPA